jgi:hypothetical protein
MRKASGRRPWPQHKRRLHQQQRERLYSEFASSSQDPIHQYRLMSRLMDNNIVKQVTKRHHSALIAAQDLRASVDPTSTRTYLSAAVGDVPLVINTGASISISPLRSNFVNGVVVSKTNALQGLSDGAHVQGEGMVSWTLQDNEGAIKRIKTKALFVPLAKVRLLSPQTLFQEQGTGSMELTSTSLQLHLHTGSYRFCLDSFSNLPMVNNASHGADNPDTMVGVTHHDVAHLSTILSDNTLSCLLSVADNNNRNLTGPQ